MAIYRLSAKVIKRSDGRSVVAAAAYRCGQRYEDERTGEVHDYTRRRGVDETHQLLPEGAAAWLADVAQCWRSVEQIEKRNDAQLAREIQLALPIELTPQQRETLALGFVRRVFISAGMVATVALHDQNGGNPHAHILLSLREATSSGWGHKRREWNDRQLLEQWREQWEHAANRALRQAGIDARIDHRTLEAQLADAEEAAARCTQWHTAELERQKRRAIVERRRQLAAARTATEDAAKQLQAERQGLRAVSVSAEDAERLAADCVAAAKRSQQRAANWAKTHPWRLVLYQLGWFKIGRYYAQQTRAANERTAQTKEAKRIAAEMRKAADAAAAAIAARITELEQQFRNAEHTLERLMPKRELEPQPTLEPQPQPAADDSEPEPQPQP
ncbi:MAG: MobQ family relaxase [Rhodanobacteraceae bacterium]